MIPAALIIPTESAPSALDIKQALLSFDQVALFNPDDRDIIPPNQLSVVRSGFPMAINMGPVRPLGKTPHHDTDFERMMETCAPARQQGKLYSLPHSARDLPGLVIGNAPLPEGTPNPRMGLSYVPCLK